MVTTKKTTRKTVSTPTGKKPIAKAPVTKKPVVKKVATSPAKPASPKVAATKPEKAKKDKLVRDSFTIPKSEYLVLDAMKTRAIKLTQPVKKSELIRAGIKALTAMNDKSFLAALQAVPAIKTGRPQKS
jgi:hypothetical protein